MIRDDYPVFQEIAILQQQLQPIRLTFNHVDGHLDKKEKTTDTETLNIECNTQAKQHSQTYPPLLNITILLMEHRLVTHTVPVMNICRVYVGIIQQPLVTVYFELRFFKKGGGTVTQMHESFLYRLL